MQAPRTLVHWEQSWGDVPSQEEDYDVYGAHVRDLQAAADVSFQREVAIQVGWDALWDDPWHYTIRKETRWDETSRIFTVELT
jgi:hypothetical protein